MDLAHRVPNYLIVMLHEWMLKTPLLCCFLRQVRERLKKDVEQMKLQDPNFRPGLVVLQVSSRLHFCIGERKTVTMDCINDCDMRFLVDAVGLFLCP